MSSASFLTGSLDCRLPAVRSPPRAALSVPPRGALSVKAVLRTHVGAGSLDLAVSPAARGSRGWPLLMVTLRSLNLASALWTGREAASPTSCPQRCVSFASSVTRPKCREDCRVAPQHWPPSGWPVQ